MEALLDRYAAAPDPARPLVCFDECGKELRADTRPPIPARPGQDAKQDVEYQRCGSVPMHLWVAPHTGRMGITVTRQRTHREFALAMRDLVDVHFPEATQVVVVLDNLNTHTAAALYRVFPPAEARRILRRLEFQFTPKHGSWLNMAELEISVLSRAVLKLRRFASPDELAAVLADWTCHRNAHPHPIRWSFRVEDARRRMPRTYPPIQQDT